MNKKDIQNILEKAVKKKFKCLKCGKILNGQEEVRKHKENNQDHFEYDMVGSKLKLGFA